MPPSSEPKGLIAAVVRRFLQGKEAILLLIFSLCLGGAAILLTPREEEPQIIVPMADVFVQAPGASASEVEKLVAAPLERLLWQIDGVEYVYSTAFRDHAMVTVRFFVGENREDSLVKLHNAIAMNQDIAPSIATAWVVKPVEIDDVPIVALTLYSKRYDDHELRRVAEELMPRLAEVPNVSRVSIIGGRSREIRMELNPERMTGLNVSPREIIDALRGADASMTAGALDSNNRELSVTANSFLHSAAEADDLVVGVFDGRPVYLRDVAVVVDGPEEPRAYSRFGMGARHAREMGCPPQCGGYPAVTIALAKKKGTNAVDVAEAVLARMDALKKTVLPADIEVEVTRDYGKTAQTKVNDLLASLFFAILTVVILLAMTLGWREALVVAVAVPVSFSLALFVNHVFGYTINRVTLFALILSLGLVVDDPITNVDNIQRHIMLGVRKPLEATLFAVQEVLPPVIMSTLAIIVSFTPMFFITGMMGPYMAPMAANVPLTVTFSTVCALTIVPWMSYKLLKRQATQPVQGAHVGAGRDVTPAWVRSGYRAALAPFLRSRGLRWLLALVVVLLLLASCSLALLRLVPLKMLPFDNKNEFQIVLDMPEGASLEATDRCVRAFEDFLRGVPEVTNFVSYAGLSSPMDFNGMVRHYYLREGAHQADIRVNLADKEQRAQQSHAVILRLRTELEAIAGAYGCRLKIVEVPPGPPVISTITAEVYGTPDRTNEQLIQGAGHLQSLMREEPGVVDIDASYAFPSQRVNFVPDKEKAALHGVSTAEMAQTLRTAVGGRFAGQSAFAGRAAAVAGEARAAPQSTLQRLHAHAIAGEERKRGHGGPGRVGRVHVGARGPAHLPQEFAARGVRVCRDGRPRPRRGHFGLAEHAGAKAHAAGHPGGVGGRRRMADHPAGVSRSGHSLWRGAFGHLPASDHPDGFLFPALVDHDGHSPDVAGHHARFLAAQRVFHNIRGRVRRSGVFHGHEHDRHDRLGRHRDTQFPRADRVRAGRHARGHALARGDFAKRSHSLAPHCADGVDHGSWRVAHHLGPHFLGSCLGPDFRTFRLHLVHAAHHSGGLLRGVPQEARSLIPRRKKEEIKDCGGTNPRYEAFSPDTPPAGSAGNASTSRCACSSSLENRANRASTSRVAPPRRQVSSRLTAPLALSRPRVAHMPLVVWHKRANAS